MPSGGTNFNRVHFRGMTIGESAAQALEGLAEAFSGAPGDVGKDAIVTVNPNRLGVADVAKMLGLHENTVRLRAKELGARKVGPHGKLVFELETIRQRITVDRVLPSRKALSPPASAEQREGERDAKVFELLEAGRTPTEIVISTKTKAEVVLHLRKVWLESKHAEREGVQYVCQGCRAPSNPIHSFCSNCGPRAHVLTDEQIATINTRQR